MNGQGTGNNITGYNEVSFYLVFFVIYFTITGVKKTFFYTKDFVIWRFIISRFHCITLICLLSWTQEKMAVMDEMAVEQRLAFLSFKHCFLFCLKSSEIQIKWPMECVSPIKWSLFSECIKLPKRGFFGHLGFSLSRERRIRYKIIFKKFIM